MKTIIIAVCILAALVFLEIIRELHSFVKVKYDIKIANLKKNKKVVFLSDLHNHVYGKNNETLLNAIREEQPDYIFIGGDMLVGKKNLSYQKALEFVKELPAICPVYYANGNHEQRMKEFPENYKASYSQYKKELTHAGVVFLENDSKVIDWDGVEVKLTGIEIPLRCYLHTHREELKMEDVSSRIGDREEPYYEILMAHNPSYMKQYLKRGADLILCGHLHGGIVRIPGFGGVISPGFEIFPNYSGDHYREGNTDIVVSKGLGTHTVNIRLFNRAELVVLNFTGDVLV